MEESAKRVPTVSPRDSLVVYNNNLQLFMKDAIGYLTALLMFAVVVELCEYLTNKPLPQFEPRKARAHQTASNSNGLTPP
jgi:hypothetical protein